MASETLDLPQPFGPTMAVTPGWKFNAVLSAKDLKPNSVKFLRYMLLNCIQTTKVAGLSKVKTTIQSTQLPLRHN